MFKSIVANLARHRSPLMGLAIIWIFIFHSGPIGSDAYDSFQEFGFGGVDIFIFLSAFGLCFSLEKDSSVLAFYYRRLKRIVPTWVTVLLIVHLLGIVSSNLKPDTNFAYPHSFFAMSDMVFWTRIFPF